MTARLVDAYRADRAAGADLAALDAWAAALRDERHAADRDAAMFPVKHAAADPSPVRLPGGADG